MVRERCRGRCELDPAPVSAGDIEAAAVGQVRTLLPRPAVVVPTWPAPRTDAPDLIEKGRRDALERLDPLSGGVFPAEHAGIVRMPVERVVAGPGGPDIRLRVEDLASLARDLDVLAPGAERVAA